MPERLRRTPAQNERMTILTLSSLGRGHFADSCGFSSLALGRSTSQKKVNGAIWDETNCSRLPCSSGRRAPAKVEINFAFRAFRFALFVGILEIGLKCGALSSCP